MEADSLPTQVSKLRVQQEYWEPSPHLRTWPHSGRLNPEVITATKPKPSSAHHPVDSTPHTAWQEKGVPTSRPKYFLLQSLLGSGIQYKISSHTKEQVKQPTAKRPINRARFRDDPDGETIRQEILNTSG